MGAVESPETEVDDANGKFPWVGVRPPWFGDASEVGQGKAQRACTVARWGVFVGDPEAVRWFSWSAFCVLWP